MDVERIERLIFCLEGLVQRPGVFRECVMGEGVPGYFAGFAFGLRFGLGIDLDQERERGLRRGVVQARGWELGGETLHEQMARRGLAPDQVVAELAAIEIDFIRSVTGQPA